MQREKLNIIPGSVSPRIHMSQYDIGRQFAFEICENTSAFTIPSGSTVSIQGKKADGHGFVYGAENNVVVYSGSTVTITAPKQMSAYPGLVDCELRILASSYDIYTCNFVIEVEEAALFSDSDLSESDIPDIKKAADAAEKIDQALIEIEEGLAKSEEAIAKVDEATKLVDQALTTANDAVDKANQSISTTTNNVAAATESEKNAKASEEAAASSATNASTSEINAKDYSNLSKSYAVGETGTRDGEDADNSKYYYEQAKSAANIAVEKSDNVDTLMAQAQDAVDKATKAADESDTALIKATEALTKLDNIDSITAKFDQDLVTIAEDVTVAKNSATAAKESETNAKSSEITATEAATSATNSASAAVNSAATIASTELTSLENANRASISETNAKNYSDLSKSYAVGETGTRDGEDTDNSKYYSELAANSQNAASSSEIAAKTAQEAAEAAAKLVSETVTGVGSFNGRSGAVSPQSGDYTPDMVGTYSKEHIDALHSTAAITIPTYNWASTTTTVDGNEYYRATVSGLNLIDQYPIINIGASGTLPTTEEETAYECIKYIDAQASGQLVFYASSKPLSDIPLLIKGATVADSWDEIADIVSSGYGESFFQ